MPQDPVILRVKQLNEHHILFIIFFEKFETRSTKFETNTNVQNPKFKTKNMIQPPDSFGVIGSNVLVI
jgi:hypothetical protein